MSSSFFRQRPLRHGPLPYPIAAIIAAAFGRSRASLDGAPALDLPLRMLDADVPRKECEKGTSERRPAPSPLGRGVG